MNAGTEITTEEKLENVSQDKPVAVYSVNFANAVGNFAEKRLVRRRKPVIAEKAVEKAAEKSFSQKILNWRNAVPVAALLAIGVLHFALQISVIRPEVSENHAVLEVPPVKVEPVRALPVEAVAAAAPVVTETKRTETIAPQKTASRVKPQPPVNRQSESAPSKPAVRKKESVESRAERLRRAERLLTGI